MSVFNLNWRETNLRISTHSAASIQVKGKIKHNWTEPRPSVRLLSRREVNSTQKQTIASKLYTVMTSRARNAER